MSNISIIGSGTWGLALANHLANKDYKPIVYSPFQAEIDKLSSTYHHPRFPSVKLSHNISFTSDLSSALKNADIAVIATPSIYVRETAHKMKEHLKDNAILVSVAKGIEDDTFLLMSEVIQQEIADHPVVALSGPTHAEEVVKGLPTLCVSSSTNKDSAVKVRDIFSNEVFRVYDSIDIKGVELCAALKNIIAIASGICDGLGFGDNAKAALISRGLKEMMRLGLKVGAESSTFYGLAGLGDLVVTCASTHSRNHEAGLYIGQGYSIEEAKQKVGMAIEGLNALKAAYHLANHLEVEMPITEAVYGVIYNNVEPLEAVRGLFNRTLKSE